MKQRGFTLLELMVSTAIAMILLAGAMTVAVQFQKRSAFEEQTMMAQLTARAVKEIFANDLLSAGMGMGNSPVTFGDGDLRVPITVLTEPDLSAAHALFPGDASTFALPPPPYDAVFRSDALQLWWGNLDTVAQMDDCAGGAVYRIREGSPNDFCTAPDPDVALDGQQAFLVNPTVGFGCHLEITGVASDQISATPGRTGNNITSGACADPADPAWTQTGWLTMAAAGASYRVNWAGGSPVLEYDPPDPPEINWVPLSRDVERLKVRQAVIDLTNPLGERRWFPDPAAGRNTAVDECVLADAVVGGPCEVLGMTPAPATDAELRLALQQRVRELEVTLIIRSQRADPERITPGFLPLDEDDFPQDGYRRRTLTFRVHARNFTYAGLVPELTP
ncbi:MAG: prepilin-type N-terminal cleavage/methylation domain-containing protein [Myxococcaceae bacterium]